MTASIWSTCFVWLLSMLPLALPDSERWLSGVSRTALCALPWIVYAGLPRARAENGLRAISPWSLIALVLPPLALAARLDVAAGADVARVSIVALTSLSCATLLGFGTSACAGDAAAARAYALAWSVLVPGVPLLCAALERGGAPWYGHVPAWLAFVARASPVGWVGSRIIGGAAGASGHSIGRASSHTGLDAPRSADGAFDGAQGWEMHISALLALCVCLLLFALGRRSALRRRRAETTP